MVNLPWWVMLFVIVILFVGGACFGAGMSRIRHTRQVQLHMRDHQAEPGTDYGPLSDPAAWHRLKDHPGNK